MLPSRWFSPALVCLALVGLASCGGGSGGSNDNDSSTITAAIVVPANPVTSSVVTLDGGFSSTSSGRTLTYAWTLTVKPAGSAATIDNPQAQAPHLSPDVVGTYTVGLTVSDGVATTSATSSFTAVAPTLTIISDVVEPVSGTVHLALSADPGTTLVTWTVDGVPLTTATGATATWDTTMVANGSHVVDARVQPSAGYYYDVVRTFQVSQSPIVLSSASVQVAGNQFTAILGAQSPNGVVSVVGTLDGQPLGALGAPNYCLDQSGASCTLNAFALSGQAATGAHVVVYTVTDGIGATLTIQLRFTI